MTIAAELVRGRTGNDARAITQAQMAGKSPNPFAKLEPTVERDVLGENITADRRLERTVTAWESFLKHTQMSLDSSGRLARNQADAYVEGIDCTNEELGRFILTLTNYQEQQLFGLRAGEFISALVNTGSEPGYSISVRHLQSSIGFLGMLNTKNLMVEGNISGNAALEMLGGTFRIKGNVGAQVGHLATGGIIIVEGDAEYEAGRYLNGATLIVKGNCLGSIGDRMQSGTIKMEGEYGKLGHVCGGQIYHKGKLIWLAGERA